MKYNWTTIIIILIFSIFFLGIYIKNNIDTYRNINPTIIHLVLYSNSPYYDQMYHMTRKYYQKFPNVKTIYYRFEPTLTAPIQYKDDVLLIQGEESYIPGILNKTLHSFEWVQRNFSNYDYIVRSNISTIIDFEILNSLLNTQPVKYGGGVEHKDDDNIKSWIQGTAIILSKDTLNSILKNKEFIDQTMIDDVALGLLVRNKIPEALPPVIFESKFVLVPDVQGNENELKKLVKHRYAFYRNRCQQSTDKEDRSRDVLNVKILLKYLNSL